MRWLVGLLVVALSSLAHADDGENWLIGPVLGVRLGGPPGERLVIGAEGGVGFGPERINFGFTHSNSDIVYVELDPWYVVGGSLGLAVNTDNGAASPVLGLWEGIPLNDGPCSEWHPQLTLAGGYRYTGRHELYVTLKAGRMDGSVCFGD